MNKFQFGSVFITLILCFGCAKKDERVIGEWNNPGNIQLVVSRDGEKLLVKYKLIDSGMVFKKHPASFENGYLLIEGDHIYEKLAYSETEDELIPVNGLPGLHRVLKHSP